jgi:hypothetical protein
MGEPCESRDGERILPLFEMAYGLPMNAHKFRQTLLRHPATQPCRFHVSADHPQNLAVSHPLFESTPNHLLTSNIFDAYYSTQQSTPEQTLKTSSSLRDNSIGMPCRILPGTSLSAEPGLENNPAQDSGAMLEIKRSIFEKLRVRLDKDNCFRHLKYNSTMSFPMQNSNQSPTREPTVSEAKSVYKNVNCGQGGDYNPKHGMKGTMK